MTTRREIAGPAVHDSECSRRRGPLLRRGGTLTGAAGQARGGAAGSTSSRRLKRGTMTMMMDTTALPETPHEVGGGGPRIAKRSAGREIILVHGC
jgi:hypothetical protein